MSDLIKVACFVKQKFVMSKQSFSTSQYTEVLGGPFSKKSLPWHSAQRHPTLWAWLWLNIRALSI